MNTGLYSQVAPALRFGAMKLSLSERVRGEFCAGNSKFRFDLCVTNKSLRLQLRGRHNLDSVELNIHLETATWGNDLTVVAFGIDFIRMGL